MAGVLSLIMETDKLECEETEYFGLNCKYTYDRSSYIGRGAFGSVFKGTITDYGEFTGDSTVAVKEIRLNKEETKQITDHKEWGSFRDRWLLLVQLKHPNLLPYYKVTVTHKKIAEVVWVDFLMEYCKDGDLDGLLRKSRANGTRLSRPTVIDFVHQIAQGIEFLHSNKIIHLDLKPANVLIKQCSAERYTMLIGDMDELVLMQTSVTCSKDIKYMHGTYRYMSPEMLKKFAKTSNEIPGRATDIWSLGCIIHDLVDCCFGIKERLLYRDEKETLQTKNMREQQFAYHILNGFVPLISNTISDDLADLIRCCQCMNSDERIKADVLCEKLLEFAIPVQSWGANYEYSIGTVVGKGSFGIVSKAVLTRSDDILCGSTMAVKRVLLQTNMDGLSQMYGIREERYGGQVGLLCESFTTLKQENLLTCFTVTLQKIGQMAALDFLLERHPDLDFNCFLRQFDNRSIRISEPQAVDCIFQIASGLRFLHEHHIIHGNLCPSNIFVQFLSSMQNRFVIGGWEEGLLIQHELTHGGILPYVQTSTRYMSPEMLGKFIPNSAANKIDHTTDIWSLGCLAADLADIVSDTRKRSWPAFPLSFKHAQKPPALSRALSENNTTKEAAGRSASGSCSTLVLGQIIGSCRSSNSAKRASADGVVTLCEGLLQKTTAEKTVVAILTVVPTMGELDDYGDLWAQIFDPSTNTLRQLDLPCPMQEKLFHKELVVIGHEIFGLMKINSTTEYMLVAWDVLRSNCRQVPWDTRCPNLPVKSIGWDMPVAVDNTIYFYDRHTYKRELWQMNPFTGNVVIVPDQNPERGPLWHSATARDGKIYMVEKHSEAKPLRAFDTALKTWGLLPYTTLLEPEKCAILATAENRLFLIASQRGRMFSGYGRISREQFRDDTNPWEIRLISENDFMEEKVHGQSCFVIGTKMYVFGWRYADRRFVQSLSLYDVKKYTWSKVPLKETDISERPMLSSECHTTSTIFKWPDRG